MGIDVDFDEQALLTAPLPHTSFGLPCHGGILRLCSL